MFSGKKGFTLIELVVVIIIIGILASISFPMMTAAVARARRGEANMALGAIMGQLRLHRTESGISSYLASPLDVATTGAPPFAVIGNVPGFAAGDLDGQFFDDNDYMVTAIAANTFTVRCLGDSVGNAPQRALVNGVQVTIDQLGTLTPAA